MSFIYPFTIFLWANCLFLHGSYLFLAVIINFFLLFISSYLHTRFLLYSILLPVHRLSSLPPTSH